jgi:hypothetical protein
MNLGLFSKVSWVMFSGNFQLRCYAVGCNGRGFRQRRLHNEGGEETLVKNKKKKKKM